MPGVRLSSTVPGVFPSPLSPTVLRDAYTRQLPDNWVIDGLSIADRITATGLNTAGDSFRVTPGSAYAANGPRSGTDGKAIGADMDQLEAAQGLIGTPTVAFDGTSAAAVNVRVPDEAAACYVFYGQGNDLTTFARTPADTSIGRVRSIRIESFLPDTDYNYVVFCSGATNSGSGSFKSSVAAAFRPPVQKIKR